MKRLLVFCLCVMVILGALYLIPAVASNIHSDATIPNKFALHVVKPGDTLWQLSKRHMPGVDPRRGIEIIRDSNGMPAGYIIQLGDLLNIPSVEGTLPEPLGPEYSSEEAAEEVGAAAKAAMEEARDLQLLSRNDLRYKELTMTATAYTAGPESTGKSSGHPEYGITRSGLPVARGSIAVDPNVIPLGSRLWVEGYGYGIAIDVGGLIKGNTVDVYFVDVAKARDWGRKQVQVRVFD